ncbi:hypothetical protein EYB53_024360 [Candidatus Chloroploca sp. M-50]|uniref:Yip1 domain-containing protein n=2 Tax=Candidatus Chloroploca TaxID=1579476 RepID=A0A2H3KIZ6_9CHLR|nr:MULTISPECIES: hypothetical protein [Candidatus Chloroploca]MBP1468866.1 hypothetical protein [Candidatus Chloroploca mongolica]PDV97846.1 hypothetical protein A9Q02_17165 [Candidatus Chloroploca asiatica]
MIGFFQGVLDYLSNLWRVIIQAMLLNEQVFAGVQNLPRSGLLTLGIALVGGISQLIGQSVILFVNRVKPGRFAFSLLLGGLTYFIGILIWGTTIWLSGRFLFGSEASYLTVLRIVTLGAAPFVFGFLVLIPYAGVFIGRVLWVWSLLIVISVVNFTYGFNFWQGAIVVGAGWLLMMIMTATIGRPIVALRNAIFKRVVGSKLDATTRDILTAFASETESEPSASERKL